MPKTETPRPNNIEYHVSWDHPHKDTSTKVYQGAEKSQEALAHAALMAMMRGKNVNLDVCVFDAATAEAHGYTDLYELDPDASVTCRYTIKADCVGIVP